MPLRFCLLYIDFNIVSVSVGNAPKILSPLEDVTSPSGRQVKLECEVSLGKPAAEIHWYKDARWEQNILDYLTTLHEKLWSLLKEMQHWVNRIWASIGHIEWCSYFGHVIILALPILPGNTNVLCAYQLRQTYAFFVNACKSQT